MPRACRALLLAALLVVLSLPARAAEQFRLTLLHTNDTHGQLLPHDYDGYAEPVKGRHAGIGGLARRATLIRQLRESATHPVVVIDTGDCFSRGPWEKQSFGLAEIEALNLMGYDLLAVGNNEFSADCDTPQAKMLTLTRRSRFPWVCANATVGDSGVPIEGLHPFVVRSYGDVRVGFLGLTPSRVAAYTHIPGWTITPPVQAAKKWVPRARAECDILIGVFHLGESEAKGVISQVSGLDAVVAGDDHAYLTPPVLVKNPEGREIPLVEAGEEGTVLGRFDLTFERTGTWRLVKAEGKLLPITSKIREDRAVARMLERYVKPLEGGTHFSPVPVAPAAQPVPAG